MTTEERLAKVEAHLNALIAQVLPALFTRIAALESSAAARAAAPAPAAAPKAEMKKNRRNPLTYEAYCKVKEMVDSGMTERDVAKETGIPYTTVRSYVRMDEARIQELKTKAENKAAVVAAEVEENTKGIVVNTPLSPGEFGEAGWHEWTPEFRQQADTTRCEDGYPWYQPAEREQHVTVMFANETIERNMVASDVRWGMDGGVIRFKVLDVDDIPF